MSIVTLREARKRLGDLVMAAEQGETVIITRRGRRVARLIAAGRDAKAALPSLKAFRASIRGRGRKLSDELLAMRAEERA